MFLYPANDVRLSVRRNALIARAAVDRWKATQGETKMRLLFPNIIEQLADGKAYVFFTSGMKGYFFKAPHPEQEQHTQRDGAISAITYWEDGVKASPTLMLYDFDEKWQVHEWANPESFKRGK